MSRVSKSKEQHQQQNPHNTSSNLPTKIEPSNMNYQMFRRESYTPYIASKTRQQTREAETPKNSVKHPITPSKQMSMSYRYSQQQSEQSSIEESGNINNNINTANSNSNNNHKQLYGRSGYYQSNNFMVNEMKVNELKKKYHMEDIENGMDVESPKYAMISFNNTSHLNGNTNNTNNNTNTQGYNYYQSERFNYNSIKHYKPTPYYQYME
jgi:hypothetical protein